MFQGHIGSLLVPDQEFEPQAKNDWLYVGVLTGWNICTTSIVLNFGGPSGTRTPDRPVMSRLL
jgi:hypothetical protein